MTFARSLAMKAVQEQANRDAHDTATCERWVNSQVVSIKSTCRAASKRCEFSAEITDSLPFLYQQEGQKKLLKELRARLEKLGFTKLQVSQEVSDEAGKVRVSMSWAGLGPSEPSPKCCKCFAFLWTLPMLLTKGFRKTAQTEKRFASPLKLPLKSQNAERSCRPWNTSELSC
ncbi:unnamed protein product [Symbiodinium sp. CCMP2456]|nr:unnamed protein product [Symbiodinium sp. CCMP2456]